MCLVVPYVKGVAYKIFHKNYNGTLRSPMNGCRNYTLNKWITDKNNANTLLAQQTVVCIGDYERIVNQEVRDSKNNIESPSGFFCYPSLQDAKAAYKLASYMQNNKLAIYRINYKAVVAQGIDESSRPALVVRMMKILEHIEDLPSSY